MRWEFSRHSRCNDCGRRASLLFHCRFGSSPQDLISPYLSLYVFMYVCLSACMNAVQHANRCVSLDQSLDKCPCVGLPRKQKIAVNKFWVQESEIGEENPTILDVNSGREFWA